ncbi:GH14904 [Drosophila grimshawi]|uniref:GH14904 n=1 Tax=Drosophila grimshawi TaxID=7222 RepID=B4J257_DROGR|nr:GH14904 [Drosophila grimshawi]
MSSGQQRQQQQQQQLRQQHKPTFIQTFRHLKAVPDARRYDARDVSASPLFRTCCCLLLLLDVWGCGWDCGCVCGWRWGKAKAKAKATEGNSLIPRDLAGYWLLSVLSSVAAAAAAAATASIAHC